MYSLPDLLLFLALSLAWWLLRRPRRGWVNLAAYYKTPHWQKVRAQKAAQAGYKCEKCGAKGRLETHHIHYRSLYHERLNDLQLLCNRCHTRGGGIK